MRHPDMPRQAFGDMWATLKAGLSWSALVERQSAAAAEGLRQQARRLLDGVAAFEQVPKVAGGPEPA